LSPNLCSEPRDCDFEDIKYPLCTWLHVGEGVDEFDWIVNSGILPGYTFLPSNDHTFKNESGSYIYLASKGQSSGDTAIIFSEMYPPESESGVCMSFYYQISGGNFNLKKTKSVRLTLFIFCLVARDRLEIQLIEYNEYEPTTLWQLTGTQPYTYWNYAQLGFFTNEYYMMFIKGQVGNSATGYSAIDDIHFSNGYCSPLPVEAVPGYTPPTTTKTTTGTTQSSIIELDCDFSTKCSWSNLPANSFNWTVVKALDGSSIYEGPAQDHSGGENGGSYLIADSVFVRVNKSIARYESPPMNGTKCVEFWYYMYGPQVTC
jgi:hypothetical protein